MSRFSNLEFGEGESHQSDRQVVKDESFYLNEGRELFWAGRFDEALRSYSKVLEFNPENASAWTAQVQMLIELEEFREAKMWADKALEKFPDEPELLAAKAVALARTGDLDSALAFSDAAVEERGDTSYVWLARGDVLLARREKRAAYCFEKAISCAPNDWFIQWLAARIHFFYKKFALALGYARRALELAPDRAIAWFETGRCQVELGLSSLALEAFAQARELDPFCPGIDAEMTRAEGAGFFRRTWQRCRNLFS